MMIAANIISMTILFAVPLLLVAMGGMFSEHSGVINIALEGMMIIGALFACFTLQGLDQSGFGPAHPQLSMFIAILVAGITGMIFSLFLAFAAINLKADQTIGGTALNLLAPALTCLIVKIISFEDKLVMPKDIGFVILNDDLPAFWRIFFDKAYLSTYVAIVLFVVLSIWLYKTKTGLRLRACGEHPQAAGSVGINVQKMRYLGTTISGVLGGLGGYIFIATAAGGTAEGTVAGMGFLALAIMIFGNWKPVGVALGALLFGFLKCMSVVYTRIEFLNNIGLPMYFYNMIPYITVLVVLAFTSKKSRAPKAEGIPYDKGMR